MITRRNVLSGGAAAAATAALGRGAAAQQGNLGRDRLVLLGMRGGPRVTGFAPSPAANLIVWTSTRALPTKVGPTCASSSTCTTTARAG